MHALHKEHWRSVQSILRRLSPKEARPQTPRIYLLQCVGQIGGRIQHRRELGVESGERGGKTPAQAHVVLTSYPETAVTRKQRSVLHCCQAHRSDPPHLRKQEAPEIKAKPSQKTYLSFRTKSEQPSATLPSLLEYTPAYPSAAKNAE